MGPKRMPQSNDKIFELVNTLRLELKADIASQGIVLGTQIGKIDEKLDKIVDDRLSPVEKDVKKLQIASATGNTKLSVLIFIGSSVVSTIITVVVSKAVA